MLINELISQFFYFIVQYIILGLIISKIIESMPCKKRIIIFSSVLALLSSFFNTYVLGTTAIILMPIINILLILMSNIFILKLSMIDSLAISCLISIILFKVNIISSFINSPLPYETYPTIRLLLLSINFIIIYKISNTNIFKMLIIKIKSFYSNTLELKMLIFLILLSFDASFLSNISLKFVMSYIQLFIPLYSIYVIYKNIELNEKAIILDTLTLQNCSMQDLVDKVRSFKHDYNNTLCAIGGYISLNDMDGLKSFYSRLNFDMHSTNNIQLINPISINEPSIYNILSSKHKNIVKNNINFDFYSAVNYKSLSVPSYELSKILGILLDNAIDAALLSEEKEITLACKNLKNGFCQITLKNSYINKDVNLQKIYEKGYSSKKVKSGLGLWEVSKIIEKFPSMMLSTEKNNEYFIQILQIPVKDVS